MASAAFGRWEGSADRDPKAPAPVTSHTVTDDQPLFRESPLCVSLSRAHANERGQNFFFARRRSRWSAGVISVDLSGLKKWGPSNVGGRAQIGPGAEDP